MSRAVLVPAGALATVVALAVTVLAAVAALRRGGRLDRRTVLTGTAVVVVAVALAPVVLTAAGPGEPGRPGPLAAGIGLSASSVVVGLAGSLPEVRLGRAVAFAGMSGALSTLVVLGDAPAGWTSYDAVARALTALAVGVVTLLLVTAPVAGRAPAVVEGAGLAVVTAGLVAAGASVVPADGRLSLPLVAGLEVLVLALAVAAALVVRRRSVGPVHAATAPFALALLVLAPSPVGGVGAGGALLVLAAGLLVVGLRTTREAGRRERRRATAELARRATTAETEVRRRREQLHEVTATVAALAHVCQLLPSAATGDRHRQLDQLLRVEIDRLVRLLDDGSGQSPCPVDLDEMIAARVAIEAAAGHHVTYRPSGLRVRARPDDLAEVLHVLLDNAREHGGGTKTRIRAYPDRGRVVVRVEDGGPGLDPALAESVFGWGVRGPGSAGHGIGLNAAKRRMWALGGDLRCESSARGAAFALDLPSATAAPGEVPVGATAEHPQGGVGGGGPSRPDRSRRGVSEQRRPSGAEGDGHDRRALRSRRRGAVVS